MRKVGEVGMTNMKRCPFCGGVAKLYAPGYEYYSPYWCRCTQCGAESPTKSSELEAEKGWNERVQDDELPTELKQKMWNAFYAEEDEYEKKFVGKEEHLNWFTVYRPWLQKGFDIAINVIADWEGR